MGTILAMNLVLPDTRSRLTTTVYTRCELLDAWLFQCWGHSYCRTERSLRVRARYWTK